MNKERLKLVPKDKNKSYEKLNYKIEALYWKKKWNYIQEHVPGSRLWLRINNEQLSKFQRHFNESSMLHNVD